MIEINNRDLFGKVIAESLVKIDSNGEINTAQKLRWVNAIGKAVARMESSDFLMTWQAESNTMVIWTVGTTNQVYEANGVCQCTAFKAGQPCWHRAVKQLYKNYLEAESKKPLSVQSYREEMASALYSKTEIKSEKLNGVRI